MIGCYLIKLSLSDIDILFLIFAERIRFVSYHIISCFLNQELFLELEIKIQCDKVF